MRETERVEPNQELRQGDIIRIENGSNKPGWPEWGIIINADCDLAHGKFDGILTILPVYSFHAYLAQFWAHTFTKEQKKIHTDRISVICRLKPDEIVELISWLAKGQPDEITERLAKTISLKDKEKVELALRLKALKLYLTHEDSPLEAFSQACRLETDPEAFARKRLTLAQTSMGEGNIFLNEIAGNPDIGFVTRMRRTYSVNSSCVFRSYSEQISSTRGDDISAVRIARLTATFRFKIAQLFAYQFSRIGLPDELAELNKLAVDDMVTTLLEART